MSDQGQRGERGPVGDHGQAGDKGRMGDTGLTGDVGLTGDTGDTGEKGDIGHTGLTGARGHRGPVLAGPLAWVILVFVVTAVLVLQGCQIRQNNKTGEALCALQADLERRVQSSKDFLEDNPEGIPGISAAQIRQGISNQQQTIDALAILDCPIEEIP